ncbi:MAG TPA: phosphoadenosine phosphosulfate reductase family protein [Roseiflexaceae bacterium]|nr:phosphoadenosine phosphosulfate reductase family protein [Roseiflexaceae bacterium]
MTQLARHPDIDRALAAGAVISYSVSGGKDSDALVLACERELRGHPGPRTLIHSDLGRIEWQESLSQCERLADKVGLDLIVVRRTAGGMIERWQQRWSSSVRRYAGLETVSLILPWSTPAMRFCTSELKTSIICRELVRRFPGQTIINALGIRAEESASRAVALICKEQPLLSSRTRQTSGYTWLPIHHWSIDQVWAIHEEAQFAPHVAYTQHGMSRVSCSFCIMATEADLQRSATVAQHQGIYQELVDLEIASTFAFQGGRWLGDVAPHLLRSDQRDALDAARERAQRRQRAEARIPAHLRFDGAGWPRVMPTPTEAAMLAEVRCEVARAVGIAIDFQTAESILARYDALMEQRGQRAARVTVQEAMAL